jgi:FAD:protein FMN transferase
VADQGAHRPHAHGSRLTRRLLPWSVLAGGGLLLLWATTPERVRDPQHHGAASTAASDLTSVSGEIFGTTWTVKMVGEAPDVTSLSQDLDRRLQLLDGALSTYRDDSELMRLNRTGPGEWVEVSPELHEVLALSKRIHNASDGAFDPTVGALVRAWGFGPDARPSVAPDVAGLMRTVGFDALDLHPTRRAVRWSRAGIQLDLSAVAKGYAVDNLAALLDAAGASRYMVEIGGEIRVRGDGPVGTTWRIGVESPQSGTARKPALAVALRDAAMATSGDYRNFYQLDGRSVSHTIDPRTGSPVTHDVGSVTVLCATAAEADAWATALNVLGPGLGESVASRAGVDYLMIVRAQDSFRHIVSPGFASKTQ